MRESKKKKQTALSLATPREKGGQTEDRTVVAVTVVWMLTFLAALAADLLALMCFAAGRLWSPPPTKPGLPGLAGGALLLAGLVTGVLCLALTPLVWRMRQVKPPVAIVVAAVVVGLMPVVTLVALSLMK